MCKYYGKSFNRVASKYVRLHPGPVLSKRFAQPSPAAGATAAPPFGKQGMPGGGGGEKHRGQQPTGHSVAEPVNANALTAGRGTGALDGRHARSPDAA